jgi:hypothetical protein
VVTGTNGKTTTTKMVATILGERYRVLTNDSGSNFVRGVVTTTIDRARWTARLPYDVAVFELDEAWAVRFAALVAPTRTLLLNVMRDQLDRFGEIDTTAKLLAQVARASRRWPPTPTPRSPTSEWRRSCDRHSRTTTSSTAGRSRRPNWPPTPNCSPWRASSRPKPYCASAPSRSR